MWTASQTGYADAYANGTPLQTTQLKPLLPVSSYFWLNSLHPTWPGGLPRSSRPISVAATLMSLCAVHNVLAHAVSTFLAGVGL